MASYEESCSGYNEIHGNPLTITRRYFLGKAAKGLGGIALGSLLNEQLLAQSDSIGGLSRFPNFTPKAKRVIYLFQSGGPPQMDLFDYTIRKCPILYSMGNDLLV
jgi:hypothetical protein